MLLLNCQSESSLKTILKQAKRAIMKQIPPSHHHMLIVKRHLEENVDRSNEEERETSHSIAQICDDLLPQMPGLPRNVLYDLVYKQQQQRDRQRLTKKYASVVREHLSNTDTRDIRTLVKEICGKIGGNPAKTPLYTLVKAELAKRDRATVTESHRKRVRQFLGNDSSKFDSRTSISELCDELGPHIDLPRLTLYQTIEYELTRMQRKDVTPEQRRLIRNHVWRHIHDNDSVAHLAGQLQHLLNMPKAALYQIVRDQVVRFRRSAQKIRSR